jgi:hypothetical protein
MGCVEVFGHNTHRMEIAVEYIPRDSPRPVSPDTEMPAMPHAKVSTDAPAGPIDVPPIAWYLPVTHCGRLSYSDAVLGMGKLMDAYWYLWDPECSLRFVTAWKDGELRLGFEATAADPQRARRLLESLRAAAWGERRRRVCRREG